MLAAMARNVGPERFAAFWTSNLPPSEAFQSATGQSLAHWTRGWIEQTYYKQTTGPMLPRSAVWTGFLLLMLGVALSVRAARRRQLA